MTISNPNMATNAPFYLQTPIPSVAIFKSKMSIFLLIQHIFAESSPYIFTDSSNFADTAYFADSTND